MVEQTHFRALYDKEVVPSMVQQFRYTNAMQVPSLEKIVLNMGVKDAVRDHKAIESCVDALSNIAGQKAVITRSKKSIAGFKLPQGVPVGCMVTLRGWKMYAFLERLVYVALPRVRDFRGVNPRSFDGNGNFSMGLKEQITFLEVNYDKIDKIRGMDITIATSARTNAEALALLKAFHIPFIE